MKSNKRIKRWVPNISFMAATVNIPVLLMCGLLFIVGQNIVFGVEGGELQTIPFPKVPIAGWLLIYLALEQLLPPVIRRRVSLSRALANIVRRFIKYYKGIDDINTRIKSIGAEIKGK